MNDMSNSPTGGEPPSLASSVIDLMHDMVKWQDLIEDAMRRVNYMYSFDDVVASVLRQQRQFFDFGDCCVIMEMQQFPQWSAYHCFLACGSTQAILRAEPKITALAKELGCDYISLSGRVGWPRRLKEHGWKHLLSTMYKEVK